MTRTAQRQLYAAFKAGALDFTQTGVNHMTDTHDARPWMATAIQIGTGDRMTVRGPTKEAVDLQLYGQAYAAEYGTVRYYREGVKS